MKQISCVSYDNTLSCQKVESATEVIGYLKTWCSKWVFQKEEGDSGYQHWQIRCRLIKKRTPGQVINIVAPQFPGNWTVTSTNVHRKNDFNYVMKADTRIEGPWSDVDYVEPPVMTRQLKAFMSQDMYPWQQKVSELVREVDDRSIKIVHDTVGNTGKSILSEFLEYKGWAWEMPPFRQMEDIMQCAMCIPGQPGYLVDMPRGMKKDKLGEFYAGLECLKNGLMYDKRYAFKKRRIDRPQIIVFTNALPEFSLMSRDRWQVYEIGPDKDLKGPISHFGASL